MWENGAPKAPQKCFVPAEGGILFLPRVPILRMLGFLWRIQMWVTNTTAIPIPCPDLQVGSWQPAPPCVTGRLSVNAHPTFLCL